MQNQYSLAYREEEREMISYCKFAGIGLIPWSPLAGGLLTRPLGQVTTRGEALKLGQQLPESTHEIVRRVEKIAEEKGWTMAQVGMAWISKKVTSPVVGISSVSKLLWLSTFDVLKLGLFSRLSDWKIRS